MVTVAFGKPFIFSNPNTSNDINRIITEVSKLIRSADPYVTSIEIINLTKSCMVQVTMNEGKMKVIITNPQDAVFDLNELENPVTPVTLTGR